jgi:hypothetical protein
MSLNFLFCLTGRAEWMDKGHRKCLILWHRIQEWADILLQFVSLNFWFDIHLMQIHIYCLVIEFTVILIGKR